MNKKKTIIAAIVLLLVCAVGGAIAYFTDTDSKTNVFTIGNVDIELVEPNWDTTDDNENDVPDAAENVSPGQSVAKDPKVNNKSTSNPAYVFMKVEVPCSTAESPATPIELFTYTVKSGWTELDTAAVACTSGGNATHVYYYGADGSLTSLAAGASTGTLFDTVALSTAVTGSTGGLSGNKNVVATGYGIQTEGLTSTAPATVWGNFSS